MAEINFINATAVLITLAALFSYANHRWLRLPTTIGLMVMELVSSMLILAAGLIFPSVRDEAKTLLSQVDFNETLLHGMLGYLLFAGALHVKLNNLAQQWSIIAVTSTLGVICSTVMVGFATWGLLGILNFDVPLLYCMLFGALISPTDPISVIGIMKQVGAPKSLETKIAGESLFNDGVGVVIFLGLLEAATGQHELTVSSMGILFVKEALGGLVLGLLLGGVAFWMLRTVENYQVEVLITLAVVAGGYPLALALHTSGPIAMVVAGLLIGNFGRELAMGSHVREHVDLFWELIDEILNAILFVLIGLEVLVLSIMPSYLLAGLVMIPLVLLSRFITVGVPVKVLGRFRTFSPHAVKILTWGGLRGGISVALALSLPRTMPHVVSGTPITEARDILITVTYIVVAFSIIAQGLTIGKLIKRSMKEPGISV